MFATLKSGGVGLISSPSSQSSVIADSQQILPTKAHHAVYRSDVDGLRAIAVLAVVAYHAAAYRMPGGFIGVDIFFVISGYLITGILLKELAQGTFSVKTFYARRIKRLFPALALVICTALILGWKLLPADAYGELGKQVLAGSAFVANLAFWMETGYFDTEARLKPLLHLWSLGVEEQFYIFWPVLLWWASRRRYPLLRIILGILIVSFLINVVEVRTNAAAAFYSPFARFWELMSGCVLAALERQINSRNATSVLALLVGKIGEQSWAPSAASLTGLAILGIGFVVTKADVAFPGWYALLPVSGTFLIILAGPTAWPNRALLSQPVVVFVGKISYPLYLWHWILLSFLAASTIPTKASIAIALALSFLLAWLTFVCVERPVRSGALPRTAVTLLGTTLSILALAGFSVFMSSGVPGRFSVEANQLKEGHPEESYRYKECFIDTQTQNDKSFAGSCWDNERAGRTLVLLWGDSHAAHLYPGLHKLQSVEPFRLAQFTATSCPPFVGSNPDTGASCREINTFIMGEIVKLRPSAVILGDRWSRDSASLDTRLKETAEFLRAAGVKDIFAIGSPPRWDPTLATVLFWFYRENRYVPQRLTPAPAALAATAAMDRRLEQIAIANRIHFVSAIDALCDSAGCRTLVAPPPAGLVSPDYDHFSKLGSEFFIERASNSGALKW